MEQTITLELLYKRTVTLEETLGLILDLLTKEDRKKKEQRDEREEISSIAPIPNSLAARLLKMSTRQLQRVRRQYRLTWEERGREVYYHLVPILKAITRLNLKWSETVLEEIKKANRKIPTLR
jgi:hypothetical protein